MKSRFQSLKRLVESYGGPAGFVLTWTLAPILLPFRLVAWTVDAIRDWWWRS